MTILYEHLDQLARHLVPLLGPQVTVVAAPAALVRRITADPAEVLVVFGPGTGLAEAVDFAQQCQVHRPRLGVVLLRHHVDTDVVAQARNAGIREVVHAGDTAQVTAACVRASQPRPAAGPLPRPSPPPGVRPSPPPGRVMAQPAQVDRTAPQRPVVEPGNGGRVIAVFSGKGGAGKSVIATNLATILAAGGDASVCLIDLDLAFGDVGIMLQLAPDRTLADAIDVAERLDHTGFRTLLTAYQPNFDVLLAPVTPAAAEQIGRKLVETVLALARASFDYVVVDCASQFSEPVLAALDAAHFHVLVATPELPALKSLRVTLDMFDLLDYRQEGRVVVLNRARSRVGLSTVDAETVLRTPVSVHLPSSREVPVSVNRGVPIVRERPGHAVSVALRGLVTKHLMVTEHFQVNKHLHRGDAVGARGLRRLVTRRRADARRADARHANGERGGR